MATRGMRRKASMFKRISLTMSRSCQSVRRTTSLPGIATVRRHGAHVIELRAWRPSGIANAELPARRAPPDTGSLDNSPSRVTERLYLVGPFQQAREAECLAGGQQRRRVCGGPEDRFPKIPRLTDAQMAWRTGETAGAQSAAAGCRGRGLRGEGAPAASTRGRNATVHMQDFAMMKAAAGSTRNTLQRRHRLRVQVCAMGSFAPGARIRPDRSPEGPGVGTDPAPMH